MRKHRAQLVAFIAVICCMLSALSAAMQQTARAKASDQQLQEAYAEHFAKIKQVLPPHSALPLLLDLTKSKIDDAGKDRDWEKAFSLSVGGIKDPGTSSTSEATSIGTTFFNYVGRPAALPVRGCEAVVIGEPVAGEVRISSNRGFVYSLFSVKFESLLKAKKKSGFHEGSVVLAVQAGGSVRFPSGHLASFIVAGAGFMGLGKRYVLFLWKPHNSLHTYMAGAPYLIENGVVFPIQTEADTSAYDGMPLDKFEAKVRDAIRQNIDAN